MAKNKGSSVLGAFLFLLNPSEDYFLSSLLLISIYIPVESRDPSQNSSLLLSGSVETHRMEADSA